MVFFHGRQKEQVLEALHPRQCHVRSALGNSATVKPQNERPQRLSLRFAHGQSVRGDKGKDRASGAIFFSIRHRVERHHSPVWQSHKNRVPLNGVDCTLLAIDHSQGFIAVARNHYPHAFVDGLRRAVVVKLYNREGLMFRIEVAHDRIVGCVRGIIRDGEDSGVRLVLHCLNQTLEVWSPGRTQQASLLQFMEEVLRWRPVSHVIEDCLVPWIGTPVLLCEQHGDGEGTKASVLKYTLHLYSSIVDSVYWLLLELVATENDNRAYGQLANRT